LTKIEGIFVDSNPATIHMRKAMVRRTKPVIDAIAVTFVALVAYPRRLEEQAVRYLREGKSMRLITERLSRHKKIQECRHLDNQERRG
jgi:hypothetical protein